MAFWKRDKWRCSGCDSFDDVWAMPVGSKHFDVRLCPSCRRQLVRHILNIATSGESVIHTAGTTEPA